MSGLPPTAGRSLGRLSTAGGRLAGERGVTRRVVGCSSAGRIKAQPAFAWSAGMQASAAGVRMDDFVQFAVAWSELSRPSRGRSVDPCQVLRACGRRDAVAVTSRMVGVRLASGPDELRPVVDRPGVSGACEL
jgi:hypothetical protein